MLSLFGMLAGGRSSGQLSGGEVHLNLSTLYERTTMADFDITTFQENPIIWTREEYEELADTEIIKFRFLNQMVLEMVLEAEEEDEMSTITVRNIMNGTELLSVEIYPYDISPLTNAINVDDDTRVAQEFTNVLVAGNIIQFRAPPTPEAVPVAAAPGGSPGFKLGGGEAKFEKVMTLEEATDIEFPLI